MFRIEVRVVILCSIVGGYNDKKYRLCSLSIKCTRGLEGLDWARMESSIKNRISKDLRAQ